MQYNLSKDLAQWLDSVRGELSRQQYITVVLKQYMHHTEPTKETNAKTHHTNGAIDALSQVG